MSPMSDQLNGSDDSSFLREFNQGRELGTREVRAWAVPSEPSRQRFPEEL